MSKGDEQSKAFPALVRGSPILVGGDGVMYTNKFRIGDPVKKIKGYEFSGVVVGVVKTLAGKTRYVVECTVPGAGGMLHIYNETILEYNDT